MTRNEMNRTLKTISAEKGNSIVRLIKAGHKATAIKVETGATIKQINAVMAWFKLYLC